MIAGQWLRCLGSDGLVFPSARSDTSVVVRGGRVEGFNGWNLVDYRGALPVRFSTFDLTGSWPRHLVAEVDKPPHPFYGHVTIGTGCPWRGDGSWSVRRVEEANAAYRSFRTVLSLYRWAVGELRPATESALARALGSGDRASVLGQRSAALLRALLGDADLRQQFLVAIANQPLEDSTQVDLATAFRGIDRRLSRG